MKYCYFCEKPITNGTACCNLCWNQVLKENDRRYSMNKRFNKKEYEFLKWRLKQLEKQCDWYLETGARVGCDCGCGGNSWEGLIDEKEKIKKQIKKLEKLRNDDEKQDCN